MAAVSGDLMDDVERDEIERNLAETRELRTRCRRELHRQREAGTATIQSVDKLGLVIDACSRWISRYEKDLA